MKTTSNTNTTAITPNAPPSAPAAAITAPIRSSIPACGRKLGEPVSSFRNEPAIDDQRLARDVSARVARQQQGRAHQLFRIAPAVEDRHLREFRLLRRRQKIH